MSTAPAEIKSKLDIVELAGEYLRLQKGGGQSMKALCPFHQEKTPSFYVHRDKQFFHCFGCGESGDIFTLYQKLENMEFPEALRELADRAGVRLPEYDPKKRSERQEVLAVLEDAARFYEAALGHAVGERARAYLEKRGLREETIASFGIGYAPDAWEALMKALKNKGHKPDKIVAAGMAVESRTGRDPYDRFRDRVMIPIRDERGTVIGFTGRIMPDNPDAERTGKYINTPETIVYHKKKVVFGLDRARDHLKEANFAVLVEGQMDVISSHEAGVRNTVAVSGTSFTEEQIDLLKRFCGRVAIAFDADVAGKNALAKSLPHAWKNGLQVLVVNLPEGYKDPDEVIQKDPELWKRAIADAQDMIAYSVDAALKETDRNDPYSKKRALDELKPIFALIADPVLHAHWTHTVAERLEIEEAVVRRELPAGGAAPAPPKSEKPSSEPAHERPLTREERLTHRYLALILNDPKRFLPDISRFDENWAPEGALRELVKMLKDTYTGADRSLLNNEEVISWFKSVQADKPELPSAEYLILLKERDMEGWTDEEMGREFRTCEVTLCDIARKRQIKELVAALGEAERGGDADRAAQLAKRLEELTKTET